MGCKLLPCHVGQHKEHTREGMDYGREYLGKSTENYLENVEGCKDVR